MHVLLAFSTRKTSVYAEPRVVHAGNVATEDVVYLLSGLGIHHGVDMNKLLDANEFILKALGRPNSSRAAKALLAARQ